MYSRRSCLTLVNMATIVSGPRRPRNITVIIINLLPTCSNGVTDLERPTVATADTTSNMMSSVENLEPSIIEIPNAATITIHSDDEGQEDYEATELDAEEEAEAGMKIA